MKTYIDADDVHENGEVGHMVTGTYGMRAVGLHKATAVCRPRPLELTGMEKSSNIYSAVSLLWLSVVF